MATSDFHTLQDADNENIAFVEETAATAPNKRKVGKAHVYIDGGTAPTPVATQMGTILSGTTGASAAAIGTTQACLSVLLINTHATLSLKWGNSTAQPATLEAGGQQIIPASNVTQVYVINGSGAATWSAIPEVVV